VKDFYSVILAGGSGERLWPYSRKDRPKQLIPFLNNESLLKQTVKRVKRFSKNSVAMAVVTFMAATTTSKFQAVALGLIGAGALGNFVDRVFLGHVRDFIDFAFWPTFTNTPACSWSGATGSTDSST
jgi:hypothetical protein